MVELKPGLWQRRLYIYYRWWCWQNWISRFYHVRVVDDHVEVDVCWYLGSATWVIRFYDLNDPSSLGDFEVFIRGLV